MSLPDWVHCNDCFYESDSGVVFYLTSCGHIMCQCCIDSTSSSICKLCSHNGNIVEINSNMRPDIAALFSDPLSVLQKSFQQVAKILQFQTGHAKRLDYIRRQRAKENNDALKYQKNIDELKKENENLKREFKFSTHRYDDHETIKSNGHSCQNMSSSSSIKNSVNSTIRGSRITLRTPPVDGKMGRVPTTSPSPRRTTPSINEAITAKIQESIIQKEPEVGQQVLRRLRMIDDQKDSLLSRFKRNLTLQNSTKQSNQMQFLVTPNFNRK